MKFLALNSFAPPDAAPTAKLLGDAAAALEKRGHTVTIIKNRAAYREAARGSRILREAVSLGKLLWSGITAPRPDRVLCLTSPPMLPVIGALVAARHKAPLVHWAMDVYPDVAVALGEIRENSILHRTTAIFARWAYRRCHQIIALDSDMADAFQERYGVRATPLAPWPPAAAANASTTPKAAPKTWLYSGNLGQAHDWKTLLDAQQILENRNSGWQLIFQGRGAQRLDAESYAAATGLKAIIFKDYVDEADLIESLQSAHALVASQRPETLGLLWPSKLALAARLGRPLVWIGPPNGGVANWIRSIPLGHAFANGEATAIADTLGDLNSPPQSDPLPAIHEARKTGIHTWVELATSL